MDYKLHKVTCLEVIGPYKLRVSFEDGTCQEADLRPILSGRIYSPLKDLELFNQVYLDDGVPTWPTGADFSPNTLHDWPERLPDLLKKAEEWRRGFKLTPSIEAQLRESKDEWQWHVTLIITQIPSGHLATYGRIGNVANQLFGHKIIPRNVAWLRKRLYELLTHDTQVPLHRLAKAGDVQSWAGSEGTRRCNDKLRGRTNPIWWDPSPERLRRLKLELALVAQKEPKKRSILELRGLGKEIWQGVDAQTYVDRLREEWDTQS